MVKIPVCFFRTGVVTLFLTGRSKHHVSNKFGCAHSSTTRKEAARRLDWCYTSAIRVVNYQCCVALHCIQRSGCRCIKVPTFLKNSCIYDMWKHLYSHYDFPNLFIDYDAIISQYLLPVTTKTDLR